MINLEDIIAVKRYHVPYPPDGLFEALDESINDYEIVSNCTEWKCISQGANSAQYVINYEYAYIFRNAQLNTTEDVIESLSEEFRKDSHNKSEEALLSLANSSPDEMRVLILNTNELESECRVICHPILYTKLRKSYLNENDIRDIDMKISKYNCSLYLDELFIGKLNGTIIEEILKKRFEYKLLINDSNRREITDEIDKLLDSATTEISICGWMGTHYLPKLTQLKNQGVRIRFVTRRPSEARGQSWKSEIEEARKNIISNFGLETLSDAHNVHGRTLIVDNKALIGSLDMNSASLTGAHTEFAILTDDPEMVRRMRGVFNSKFQPLSSAD